MAEASNRNQRRPPFLGRCSPRCEGRLAAGAGPTRVMVSCSYSFQGAFSSMLVGTGNVGERGLMLTAGTAGLLFQSVQEVPAGVLAAPTGLGAVARVGLQSHARNPACAAAQSVSIGSKGCDITTSTESGFTRPLPCFAPEGGDPGLGPRDRLPAACPSRVGPTALQSLFQQGVERG